MSEASFDDLCGIREITLSPSCLDISGITGRVTVTPPRGFFTAFGGFARLGFSGHGINLVGITLSSEKCTGSAVIAIREC